MVEKFKPPTEKQFKQARLAWLEKRRQQDAAAIMKQVKLRRLMAILQVCRAPN